MTAPAPHSPALEISCTTCGALVVVEEDLRTVECPYCASPHVVERPPQAGRPDPVFVLAFTLDREAATSIVNSWIKSRGPFVKSGLKEGVLERTRGVYLPSYLYGARAHANYTAKIGEDYTVTVTYTTTDSKGRTVTRTRTETRTEWRDLAGRYECYVTDTLVTASKGIGNAELESVEPFDLRALRRYSPDLLAGWIAEEPSLAADECRRTAQSEMRESIGQDLAAFMPGDSSSNIRANVTFSEEVSHLVLLPVWVFALRYGEDEDPIRIVINGQNGQVGGRLPLSWAKIGGTVLFSLLALAAIFVIAGLLS
ncbi:MAG TPA: hypothetical protein EYQ74_12705 [Planctomycetes bacterium]|nr:hypothetical protein [Planctomycetota bacterium]HIK62073.1 hypothetical protein [Planctomycetota bacterium]